MSDFYEDVSKKTKAIHDKEKTYIDLAIEQGDSVYRPKPGVVEITIITKKKEKSDAKA